MRIAPKKINCISVIYNTSVYAYMPHTYATVKIQRYYDQLLMGSNKIYPTF